MGNILEDKKKEFSQKILLSKTGISKQLRKSNSLKIYSIMKLILRAYSAYDSELDLIKSKENSTTFDTIDCIYPWNSVATTNIWVATEV